MSKCWFDLLCRELSGRSRGEKGRVRSQLGRRMHINRAALKQLVHLTVYSDEYTHRWIVRQSSSSLNALKEKLESLTTQPCYY